MLIRSNAPSGWTSSTITGTIADGVAGRGVSIRTRSVSASPPAPSTSALSPVPPMSMASVRSFDGAVATALTSDMALEVRQDTPRDATRWSEWTAIPARSDPRPR